MGSPPMRLWSPEYVPAMGSATMVSVRPMVPEAPLSVQYGGRRLPSPAGLVGLPGGRLVDASGQLVKACKCCGREFHPPRERPNPDYCDNECGTFAAAFTSWAMGMVSAELNPQIEAPLKEPSEREFLPVERWGTPAVLAFTVRRRQEALAAARQKHMDMRGVG